MGDTRRSELILALRGYAKKYWWLSILFAWIVFVNWPRILTQIIPPPTPTPTPTPTALPEWIQECTADAVETALDNLNYAAQDFHDANDALADALKLSQYEGNSPVVAQAMTNMTAKRRAIERITVPECIDQAHYSLIGYAKDFESYVRSCVVDHDCSIYHQASYEEDWWAFGSYFKLGRCLQNWPPPSDYCWDNYDPWPVADRYNPDGSIYYTPAEQATADAFAKAYRQTVAPWATASARAAQP